MKVLENGFYPVPLKKKFYNLHFFVSWNMKFQGVFYQSPGLQLASEDLRWIKSSCF
jgi:hypothetical protein